MYKVITVVAFCLNAIFAIPIDIVENEEGNQFYLVPLARHRRESGVKWDAAGGPQGTHGKLGYEGKIFENNRHRIDATPFVEKNFDPNGPLSGGGQIGYTHLPTDSRLTASASHIPVYGNRVDLGANVNLFKHGNTRIDAGAGWSRNYGGLIGTTKPEFNTGINFSHKFGTGQYWH